MTYTITQPLNGSTPHKLNVGHGLFTVIVQFDVTSYATGGEVLVPGDYGFNEIIFVSAISTEVSNLIARLNSARTRFILTVPSTGNEAASTSDGGTWIVKITGVPG